MNRREIILLNCRTYAHFNDIYRCDTLPPSEVIFFFKGIVHIQYKFSLQQQKPLHSSFIKAYNFEYITYINYSIISCKAVYIFFVH